MAVSRFLHWFPWLTKGDITFDAKLYFLPSAADGCVSDILMSSCRYALRTIVRLYDITFVPLIRSRCIQEGFYHSSRGSPV